MRILVTGAAGLVGGEVCARLVAAGHSVTALVHRNRDICANDNSPVAVAHILSGDVSQDRFGWEEAEFARVAESHDLLIHCAATVRFDLEEDDYRAVNVGGTANALALAKAGGMRFLHVSTAYVCGTRDGVIREGDPLPESGFANGYEASKAAGERLVKRSGLDWAIARPSIVVGEHASGAIRQFDTTYAAFKLIAEGRVRHMPARKGATLDFVPIDHVAGGIVAIAERMDAATADSPSRDGSSGVYHLVSGQPLPVERFTGAIGAYPQFHEPDLVAPEDFDPAQLPALERRLFRRVAGLYASYFQRDPHFDDAGFRALTGRSCPETGEAYIRRLIDHCIAVGFLPASECADSALTGAT
ncbi:SDR family oxidoreductase [Erythrobacter sp. HKB08]|uniref:SDR family oxidoreductase n=1 Tax=Erythrobacter sp. HKB08 TaxID=2502843 RepID=UPI001F2ACB69|nr:SDR family oxidoreductase [Erythrobacter sp. HKB08]